MNRPLKFRAWLKDHYYYQGENTASAMNGLERFVQVVAAEKGYTPTVEQFTGLLDKTGKEIFEGDWVKIPGLHHPRRIDWLGAGFWAVCPFKPEEGMDTDDIEPTQNRAEAWEVIGDIHSNPDLLNGGKTDE